MNIKVLAVSIIAVVMSAGAVLASTVALTAHNMSTRGSNSTTVCEFCHTPHNANKTLKAPLWNRTLPSGSSYVLYSSATAKNRIYKSGLTSSSISLGCMSCHDGGAIGGRVINNPADVPDGTPVTANVIAVGKKNFGSDLSGHHPVNFNLDDSIAGTAELNMKFMITGPGNIPLYKTGRAITGAGDDGTGVECSSCHDSHDNTYGKFLRKTNVASALCLTCHIK